MDITQQKGMYENFKTLTIWSIAGIVVILALMGIFLT